MHNHQRFTYPDTKGVPKEWLKKIKKGARAFAKSLQNKKTRRNAKKLEKKLSDESY